MSKELRGDDPRTFMGQIDERITGHAPGYDVAIYARPHQWRYLVEDHERLCKSAAAIDKLILVIESAVRNADPQNHPKVMAALKSNRAALGNQQSTPTKEDQNGHR